MRAWSSCVAAALAAGAMAVVACGGDDGGGGGAAPAAPDASTGGDAGPGDQPPPQPTSGCGASSGKTGFLSGQSIDVGGTKRTYALFAPDGATKPLPIVVVFHGDGGSGAGIRRSFDMEKVAAGGAVFIYPDGLNQTWQNDDPSGLAADVAFVDAVVAKVAGSYCTDAQRVFAVGFSRGAYFVNQLVCRSKSHFRGVVSNSGGGPFGVQDSEFNDNGDLVCPSGPMPSMAVHGEDDGVVELAEGEKTRDYWKQANGCKDSTSPYDPSPCVAYDGCSKPVVWCQIPGMGHAIWQNTSTAAWKFFGGL